MMIDPIVHRYARQFGGESDAFERLIQSVVNAEGGITRILRAVRCSEPGTPTTEKAVEILCRSAVHAMADYLHAHDASEFVASFGATWAPLGVRNDPTNLNKNWPVNVTRSWVEK